MVCFNGLALCRIGLSNYKPKKCLEQAIEYLIKSSVGQTFQTAAWLLLNISKSGKIHLAKSQLIRL
jgi:hypothetical protein